MSTYQKKYKVSLGASQTGLTVEYQLILDDLTTIIQNWTSTGVHEAGMGEYWVKTPIDYTFSGLIRWRNAADTAKVFTTTIDQSDSFNDGRVQSLIVQLLGFDFSTVEGLITVSARSMLNALRLLRNKVLPNAGTLHVKKEDDSTDAWTAAYTTDPAAAPITSIDPA